MREKSLGSIVSSGGTFFKVWAPLAKKVTLILENGKKEIALKERSGYHTVFIKGLGHGSLYRYKLNEECFADPCSSFQPSGPLGPSMVVDHRLFKWTDRGWPGIAKGKQVIYEIHIGAFSPSGTFEEATKKLAELKWLGITAIEVMPVAEAYGRWGWGYDGVNLFAPNHHYGECDSFKKFIDKAHFFNIAVILDVVYNHFGPSGNFLSRFSPFYFKKKKSEWGESINYWGNPYSPQVRNFFLENACYWIKEFHLDGLRFDAVNAVVDESEKHILGEIICACKKISGGRRLFFTAENNLQDAKMFKPLSRGGLGIDAAWSDDFHRTAMVSATGRQEGYMTDFPGKSQNFISALKDGYLFQGQFSAWIRKKLGTPVGDLPAEAFIFFLQNHDQIANSLTGGRITGLCPLSLYRTLTTLLFLAPENALLFMGQEFASSSVFVYFADQEPGLKKDILKGRRVLIGQFRSYKKELDKLADPYDKKTFLSCKLNHLEKIKNRKLLIFHRDLIKMGRFDPVISVQKRQSLEGAVLDEKVFFLRFQSYSGTRLLFVNTARTKYVYKYLSLPIVAPPSGKKWRLIWRSDHYKYGGRQEAVKYPEKWLIPGYSALLFTA